jgi:hypothetical protein
MKHKQVFSKSLKVNKNAGNETNNKFRFICGFNTRKALENRGPPHQPGKWDWQANRYQNVPLFHPQKLLGASANSI